MKNGLGQETVLLPDLIFSELPVTLLGL